MKNPSSTAAFVLVGLALLVGGFAYLTTGDELVEEPVDVITKGTGSKVGFVALTPRERKKKSNLEEAKRKLKRIRETGKEVSPGVFRIKDENGTAIYYLDELVEGVGRYGEPLFMAVEWTRRPMVPLKVPRVLTGKNAPKVAPGVYKAIAPLKPHSGAKSVSTSAGSGDGDADGGGGSGKKKLGNLTDG